MLFTIPFAICKAKDWRSLESSAPSRLTACAREAAWALAATLESVTESNSFMKNN